MAESELRAWLEDVKEDSNVDVTGHIDALLSHGEFHGVTLALDTSGSVGIDRASTRCRRFVNTGPPRAARFSCPQNCQSPLVAGDHHHAAAASANFDVCRAIK
jgi:hypothetical protein